MQTTRERQFERTDIWREGKWLDLWSVVHFLSGISIGLGLYLLHFDALAAVVLVFVLLVSYEMWEVIVRIDETPTNRIMDVVVGMTSFLPTFFILAPRLSLQELIVVSVFVVSVNILMSAFGWRASQKAAALEMRLRARYAAHRARVLKKRAQQRNKFRR